MLPLIFIGGGGHAKVLAAALSDGERTILGYIAPKVGAESPHQIMLPHLGDDKALLEFSPEDVELINGIGSTGNPNRRSEIFIAFRDRGYSFASVIHSSAVLSGSVTLEEGVQIMAGAVIQTGSTVGANSVVNTSASIDHDCQVGSHCHIAPGAILCGGVTLADFVHVGAGAVIRNGIEVGCRAIIGAGAAVVEDVAADTVVVGVPARNKE